MVLTRSQDIRDIKPSSRERTQSRGKVTSHGWTRGSGRARGSAPSRSNAMAYSHEPCVKHVRGMNPTSVLLSSSTLVLEGFLVRLTLLDAALLSVLGVSTISSMVPPIALDSTLGTP